MNQKLERQIIIFLSKELSLDPGNLSPQKKIRQDLGVDGGDALELLEAFSTEFGVEFDTFRINDYFGPEAGINPVLSAVLWVFGNSKPLKTLRILDLFRAAKNGRF